MGYALGSSLDSSFYQLTRQVRAATTRNITLSNTQSIDGVTLAAEDRVLVKDQQTPADNGIYIVKTGAWVRAFDANTAAKLPGARVSIAEGTYNGGTQWFTDWKATDTLGTTNMVWRSVSIQVNLRELPIFVYGNSYSITSGAAYTVNGKYWPQLTQLESNASAVTSYGITGSRIIDTLNHATGTGTPSGGLAPASNAVWPGVSSRRGVVFMDGPFSDIGHYPSMTASPAVPALITGTDYINSMKACWRTLLALLSSESRVEQSAASLTGTWTNTAFAQTASSGGTVAYSTNTTAVATYTITPPQYGPLAGRVYHYGYTLSSAAGVSAPIGVSIDGGAVTIYTPPAWEQYTGYSSTLRQSGMWVIPIDLPIDNASHTIALTHQGSAGHFFYTDCILVPSVNPNPIIIMGNEVVTANLWTAAQCGTWQANRLILEPYLRDVVAEFSHAYWADSTMTTNGLYSGDGIHPNTRGMIQRKNDAIEAMKLLDNWLRNYEQSQIVDASFEVV